MDGPDDLRSRYRQALSALSDPRDEGAKIDAAVQALRAADDAGALEVEAVGVGVSLFLRLGLTEEADRRWPLEPTLGRLAAAGDHRSLIYQLPRVKTDADRRALLAAHRACAERFGAGSSSVATDRPPGSRLRVGLLSSDLRLNVVTAFAEPVIEHARGLDVELYCYSAFPGAPDAAQQHLSTRAHSFRHFPAAPSQEIAAAIAADGVDVLIEIGGSTNANRLDVMASRLAPVQASWLGYPHSTGLGAIDRIIADPFLAPPDPSLLLERPLLMPRSWITLSPAFFRDDPPVPPELPSARNGYVTFGSAGSPYKYTARTTQAWARVLARVPRSRFLFVRPEGGSPTFRRSMAEAFAREGVAADRLEFRAVRGGHLPFYGEMDISLDTMPLAGGATTCESLWMGVPVVSLAGPALFERLGYSILNNVGLGDLCADDVEGYIEAAVTLAADPERRAALRHGLRDQVRASPVGQHERFAADFFDMLRAAVAEAR